MKEIMTEYSVNFPGQPHEDIVRGISDRERHEEAFANLERMVDAVFDELGVGVGINDEAGEAAFTGEFVDDFRAEEEAMRARAREEFFNRPA